MNATNPPIPDENNKSISETGHAKNAANFEDLLAFVTGYGTTYNPSKETLMLPALKSLHDKAKESIIKVTDDKTSFNDAVNARATAYDALKPLATKLINALEATDAPSGKIADAKAFITKLRGKSNAKIPFEAGTPGPTSHSTSQLSFDQQIEHFSGLVSVLESEPSYNPNETELQTTTLQTLKQELAAKNTAVANANATITNARINRNKILYNEATGLVAIAADVKNYVKSVYGASSPEYKQFHKIRFRGLIE